MASIFISYSRKNIDFAKRLTGALQEHELNFWVDWEGIPPTMDWWAQIEKGIEEADIFLFLISPDSAKSKVCEQEIDCAVKNGKRLIPLVVREVKGNEAPPQLSRLNWIFFRESDDFDAAINTLLTAIKTDYDWAQTHRRLQVKALEWERGNKDSGFLLRGKDLEEAEQQISVHANADPPPIDLQREYVLKSRQATDRQSRRTTVILLALVAVMLGIIGLLVKPYVEEAIAKSRAKTQSKLIPVPAGSATFQMDATTPIQTDDVAGFNIEQHAVTNQVYRLCVNVNKCTPQIGSTNFAESQKQDDSVVWVSIVQAAVYCEWIGRRLPDAMEWEHAARQNGFTVSDYFEWTSSYLTKDMQSLSGTLGWTT